MKKQLRLRRNIALRFELFFLKSSSASDWITCTKEYELIKSGHTFELLAVTFVLNITMETKLARNSGFGIIGLLTLVFIV